MIYNEGKVSITNTQVINIKQNRVTSEAKIHASGINNIVKTNSIRNASSC